MTPPDSTPAREPVTLDEQIASVRLVIEFLEKHDGRKNLELPSVLATLQQHKRAMAIVEAARHAGNTGYVTQMMYDALAAFDTAEPSEP